jgi:LysM repeat protein
MVVSAPTDTQVKEKLPPPYFTVTTVNGLRAFYAPKGTNLLQEANRRNIRYARLIELNDVPEAPLEADMYIYLERKLAKGLNDYYRVRPGETMVQIAQSQGIQLRFLRFYNKMLPGEEPVAGSRLRLKAYGEDKPETYKVAVLPTPSVGFAGSAPPPVPQGMGRTRPGYRRREEALPSQTKVPVPVPSPTTAIIPAPTPSPSPTPTPIPSVSAISEAPSPAPEVLTASTNASPQDQLKAEDAPAERVAPMTSPVEDKAPEKIPTPQAEPIVMETTAPLTTIKDTVVVVPETAPPVAETAVPVPDLKPMEEEKPAASTEQLAETTAALAGLLDSITAPVPTPDVEVTLADPALQPAGIDAVPLPGSAPAPVVADSTTSIAPEAAEDTKVASPPPAEAPANEFDRLKARLDKVVYAAPPPVPEKPKDKKASSTPAPGSAAATGKATHTVNKGETVFSIAKQHNLTVKQLMTLNKLDFGPVKVGQVLKLREK